MMTASHCGACSGPGVVPGALGNHKVRRSTQRPAALRRSAVITRRSGLQIPSDVTTPAEESSDLPPRVQTVGVAAGKRKKPLEFFWEPEGRAMTAHLSRPRNL